MASIAGPPLAGAQYGDRKQDRKLADMAVDRKKSSHYEIKPVNERFRNLHEYLAWAKSKRFIDVPWYEETSPGVYHYHHGRGPYTGKTVFTERELREKFGFDH